MGLLRAGADMRVAMLLKASLVCGCAAPSPAAPPGPSPLPVPPLRSAPVVETPATSVVAPAPAASSATIAPAAVPGSACAAGEVHVPGTGAAGFVMGKAIKGEHHVVLTHGFCIDATEVTVRDYARCVEAGACKGPSRDDASATYPSGLDLPVERVSWRQARAYCAWAGKRLPTEAEWEWAATGPEQTRYPWGDAPEPSCAYADYTKYGEPKWEAGGDAGCGGSGPSPVGAHPRGDRHWPDGAIHDLAGNVWEWVEDSFAPYAFERTVDPLVHTDTQVHVIRGGGWNRSYAALTVTYRGAAHEDYAVAALGFRCVRGEAPAAPSRVHE